MKINKDTNIEKVNDNIFRIGSIVVWAYHYSARIVTFGRVTRMTGSTIWVNKIEKHRVSGDFMQGEVMPNLEDPGTPMKKSFRIKKRADGTEFFKESNYCFGQLWDGKPEDEWSD